MKPKSVFSQQGNKSAIDLSKLLHPAANKSRTGKIFSLENVCPKITIASLAQSQTSRNLSLTTTNSPTSEVQILVERKQ